VAATSASRRKCTTDSPITPALEHQTGCERFSNRAPDGKHWVCTRRIEAGGVRPFYLTSPGPVLSTGPLLTTGAY
jgi:hypothetical protein